MNNDDAPRTKTTLKWVFLKAKEKESWETLNGGNKHARLVESNLQ